MTSEPNIYEKINSGWIEVICGCMFSGKTEELQKRLKRGELSGKKVIAFKHQLDDRYGNKLISHDKNSMDCLTELRPESILKKSVEYDIVGIDEVQFFDDTIVEVCNQMANRGQRVLVSGLDMDSEGKPFGPVPNLLATAEFITKLHAVCEVSGEMASYSFRLDENEDTVFVGAKDKYQARSRSIFYGL